MNLFKIIYLTIISLYSVQTKGTEESSLEKIIGGKKSICYYENEDDTFIPPNIEKFCTHIIYTWWFLDSTDLRYLTSKLHDTMPLLEQLLAYRSNHNIKVLVQVKVNEYSSVYDEFFKNATLRSNFAQVMAYLFHESRLDGLDFVLPCLGRFPPDEVKLDLAAVVKELSTKFHKRSLLLAVTVVPYIWSIDRCYNVPLLSSYVDWFIIEGDNYYNGLSDNKTGHTAPLLQHPEDEYESANINFTLHYYIGKGARREQIMLSIPFHGQTFTIDSTQEKRGLNTPSIGCGNPGEFTNESCILAYYEICDRVKHQNWTEVQDPEGRMGPYAYKGDQWVSYDDPRIIKLKVQLVKELKLGGVASDIIEYYDDSDNTCGDGKYPLLTAIVEELMASEPNPYLHYFKLFLIFNLVCGALVNGTILGVQYYKSRLPSANPQNAEVEEIEEVEMQEVNK